MLRHSIKLIFDIHCGRIRRNCHLPSIDLSSEAFISTTLYPACLATTCARVVFPRPGGPWSKATFCFGRPLSSRSSMTSVLAWPETKTSWRRRHFNSQDSEIFNLDLMDHLNPMDSWGNINSKAYLVAAFLEAKSNGQNKPWMVLGPLNKKSWGNWNKLPNSPKSGKIWNFNLLVSNANCTDIWLADHSCKIN